MGHFVDLKLPRRARKQSPTMEKPLFALTLAAGMESDAESILQKKHTEGLNRMKEANKYADWLLAQDPDATDAFIALGISNYVIGLRAPVCALRALVRWSSRQQVARDGAGRQNCGARTLAVPLRKNHPCPCRPPRKIGYPRRKVVTGTVRAVSG